jgi:CubicO group peptidase (beta-lactamase class C family)
MQRTADPDQVGLDPKQLARLDAHFAEYVDDGRLAGWQLVVARHGEVAHASTYGMRDLDSRSPVEPDTLWRIYSMTKPITSVAAMMLWEEGRFELTDEISRWLPEFADVRVFDKGSANVPVTVPAIEPIRVWHLLTHTSGLTYGHMQSSPVDAIYRNAGFDFHTISAGELGDVCRRWAALPLLFQPGSAWGYSVATDVLGRLVEVISGQSLADFCADRIFAPLGMTDARWWVDGDDIGRLATLYAPDATTGRATRWGMIDEQAKSKPEMYAGGAGLICTAQDYQRFMQMLRNEGESGGERLLGSRTVRFMTRNHLPGGKDVADLQTGGFAETTFEGIGFGLGFAVVRDPVPARVPSSPGTYYWGGAASTAFWIDPVEDLTVSFFTQLVPSSHHPIRPQLRQLVYSALRP